MANGPREEQCPYTRHRFPILRTLKILPYLAARNSPVLFRWQKLLVDDDVAEVLCTKLLVKARWPGRLGACAHRVWEARQRYLQLASIYWSLFAITTWFALTKPTATTEQTGLCSPYRAHNCLHGLPPAHVLRSTTQCWNHFSILSNTTYKSYLNLEIYPFTASKAVIQYHALPICRDHYQSAPNGGIYFGRDVKLHHQTAWRSRRARRGDCFH